MDMVYPVRSILNCDSSELGAIMFAPCVPEDFVVSTAQRGNLGQRFEEEDHMSTTKFIWQG
jgi:hypothetical protein